MVVVWCGFVLPAGGVPDSMWKLLQRMPVADGLVVGEFVDGFGELLGALGGFDLAFEEDFLGGEVIAVVSGVGFFVGID